MRALLAALLAFGAPVLGGAALAAPSGTPPAQATVTVTVQGGPQLTFSRLATSTVTLKTPFGGGSGLLLGGVPYPANPQDYWASLTPLRVRLPIPAGTPPGRYPVTASTTLYVCDQTRHLCSVRPAQVAGTLQVGTGTGAATLALTLPVPPLGGFRP